MKYFDNCATSIIDNDVLELMYNIQKNEFYNPSSLYNVSTEIQIKISHARETIAEILGAHKSEIYFTSGGTESNNLAIFGSLKNQKGKIITSMAEHASVYNSINELKNRGFEIVYAPLNHDGTVKVKEFENLVDENTRLVALMHVNNETGGTNDIKQLCKITKEKNKKCLFFCDGVQAFCKIPVNVKNLDVDLYSLSAHKIHGPKGIGALYVKKGLTIKPIIFGGGQENKLRSGTENVAGIIGFGKAAEIANSLRLENSEKYLHYKAILQDIIADKVSDFKIISQNTSSPNIFSVAYKDIKSEVIVHILEQHGFFVGNGSACNSKSIYSRVASAIGLSADYAEGIIRICFCKYNIEEEVKELGIALCKSVNELRKLVGERK